MPARAVGPALVRACLCAALALAPALAEGGGRGLVPDHAKLQLAGNIGFLSPGVGWALAKRVDGDVFFGWVPEGIGGTDIFSTTGKLTWAPWSLRLGAWTARPLTAALQLTYTFGEQYVLVPSEPFTPTALRAGIGLGGELGGRVRGRRAALYYELVALDLPLAYWVTNRGVLEPWDVFSLAVGVRIEL